MQQLKDKNVVVVGGNGFIGQEIVARLLQEGCRVTVICRSGETNRLRELGKQFRSQLLVSPSADVTDEQCIAAMRNVLLEDLFQQDAGEIYALVYAAGHCPRGGFMKEISTPLTERSSQELSENLQTHVIGLANCCNGLLDAMEQHGHILAISSGITRLTDETCPSWLHAGQYSLAKVAQDEYVRWLRRDPHVRQKGLYVHRIAPVAVDTPFHHGAPPNRTPPALLPVSDVVVAVLAALQGSESVDRVLAPQPKS